MVEFKKHIFPIFGYLCLTIIVYRFLFLPGYVGHGDWTPSYDWAENLRRFGWTLDSFTYGGTFNIGLPTFPIVVFFSLIEGLLNSAVANRFYVILSCTLGFYTMYILSSHFMSKNSAFISGLFYGLNPWVSSRVLSGHYPLLLGYSLIPLFFYFYFITLESDEKNGVYRINWKFSIYSAFVLALIGASIPLHEWLLSFFALAVFLISQIAYRLYQNKSTKIVALKTYLSSSIVIIVLGTLLSLFWILPFFRAFLNQVSSGYLGVDPFWLHENAFLYNVIRLKAYWWTPFSQELYRFTSPFLNNVGEVASFVPFLLSVLAVFFYKPKKSVHWAFLALLACSIAFNMGTNLFGSFYYPLSFLGIFRDPDKFGGLVSLSLAFLSASFIDRLLFRSSENNNKVESASIRKTALVLIVVIAIHALINMPGLSGDFRENIGPLPMPESYFEINQYLNDDPDDFRVLWLPAEVYLWFSWSQGRALAEPAKMMSGKPSLNPPEDPGRDSAPRTSSMMRYVTQLLLDGNNPTVGKILGLFNVKYVVLRSDVETPNLFPLLLSGLNSQEDLRLLFESDPLYVYENQAFLPEIRVASKEWLLLGGLRETEKIGSVLPSFSGSTFSIPQKLSHLENEQAVLFSTVSVEEAVINNAPSRYRFDAFRYAELMALESDDPLRFHPIPDPVNMSDGVATTWTPNTTLKVPLEIKNGGQYHVYIKCGGKYATYTFNLGEYSLFLEANPKISWISLGSLRLEEGDYTLQLTSERVPHGFTVEEIFVSPSQDFMNLREDFIKIMTDHSFFLFAEAEDFTKSRGSVKPLSVDSYSGRKGVLLNGKIEMTHDFPFISPESGYYIVKVRGNSSQTTDVRLTFLPDSGSLTSGAISLGSELDWYTSNLLFLEKGDYRVLFESDSASLDAVLVFRAKDEVLLTPYNDDYSLKLLSEAPTQRRVRAHGEEPFQVVYSGSYSDTWNGFVDDNPEEITLSNFFGMAIRVNEKAFAHEVVFNYSFQASAWIGNLVSLSTLFLVLSYLLLPDVVKRFISPQKTPEGVG